MNPKHFKEGKYSECTFDSASPRLLITFVLYRTYTNFPTSCYDQNSKPPAKKHNQVHSLLNSAFEKLNENMSQASRFMEKEMADNDTSSEQLIISATTDEIFRHLVLKELNELDPKKARSKRKKLLKLTIDYDSGSSAGE